MPARGVHRARKRLEQRLHNGVRLVAVKQFQRQIAPRLVGEPLEKFARQPKPERAGQVLGFFRVGNLLLRKRVRSQKLYPIELRMRPSILQFL